MGKAASCRPLTMEAPFRSQNSPCEISGGKGGTATGFSPSTTVFPCHYLFPVTTIPRCSILTSTYTSLLPEGQTGEAWEPPKKQCYFGNRGALDRKVLALSL
jgi:hypothetical protein